MTDRKTILIASFWIVGIYGLSQLVRLGSNLIITRILEPEMFGIMALVNVVLHGLVMFSDLGLWAFVVRHKTGTDPRLLNVVWTIQVIRGWGMFFIILLTTFAFMGIKQVFQLELSGVYNEDVFPIIIILVGFTSVINGYNSMAPAVVSRDIKRGKLESIELSSQLFSVLVMITWALIQPTIWALVSAGITASLVRLFLLHKVFPIRHHLTWDKQTAREVFDFGKWIVLASTLTYIAQQGDTLFFGSYISPALLGVYSIAFMLNNSVSAIVKQLVFKIWFPVLSKIANNDRDNLKVFYYKLRLKQDLFLFIMAGIIFASAQTVIDFLYDERYQEAGWVLKVLSISLIGQGLSMIGLECLSALGITKYRVKVMFVRAVGLLVGLPLCYNLFGFNGAVYCVALNIFLGLPIIYFELYKNNIFSFFSEIRVLPLTYVGYFIGNLLVGG